MEEKKVYANSRYTKPNLDHWRYQLNQLATLLQIAITACSLDDEPDVLVRVSYDKAVRLLRDVSDAVDVENAMNNTAEQSRE